MRASTGRLLPLLAVLALPGCPRGPSPPRPLPVTIRSAGTAARWFDADIDGDRAMSLVAFLDPRFREPGNLPYREALDEVEARLRLAGFGADPRLTLERWTLRDSAATWEPLGASLEVVAPEPEPLLSFQGGADHDRTMLLIGSPGTNGTLDARLVADGDAADIKNRAVLARGFPDESYGRLAEAHATIALFSPDARPEGPVATDDAIPFGEVPASGQD